MERFVTAIRRKYINPVSTQVGPFVSSRLTLFFPPSVFGDPIQRYLF